MDKKMKKRENLKKCGKEKSGKELINKEDGECKYFSEISYFTVERLVKQTFSNTVGSELNT